jgi:hypothetical protein
MMQAFSFLISDPERKRQYIPRIENFAKPPDNCIQNSHPALFVSSTDSLYESGVLWMSSSRYLNFKVLLLIQC